MTKLVKLVRLSSKEAFRKLRENGEMNCQCIGKKIRVTNLFLKHISGSSKKRELDDIVERLSCINLIEKIILDGVLVETREKVYIDKKRFFDKTFKIKINIKNFDFFLVLGEKKDGKVILISVFFNFLE